MNYPDHIEPPPLSRPHRESKWQVVKDFVNDNPVFTAREYYAHCAAHFVCKKTAENYRVFLTGAGYLAKIERLWRRQRRIPAGYGVQEIFRLAYGRELYQRKETP